MEGGTVVVAKAGKPMVQLVPVAAAGGARPLGLLAGPANESADCWSPDQKVEQWFYGEEKVGAPRVAE